MLSRWYIPLQYGNVHLNMKPFEHNITCCFLQIICLLEKISSSKRKNKMTQLMWRNQIWESDYRLRLLHKQCSQMPKDETCECSVCGCTFYPQRRPHKHGKGWNSVYWTFLRLDKQPSAHIHVKLIDWLIEWILFDIDIIDI